MVTLWRRQQNDNEVKKTVSLSLLISENLANLDRLEADAHPKLEYLLLLAVDSLVYQVDSLLFVLFVFRANQIYTYVLLQQRTSVSMANVYMYVPRAVCCRWRSAAHSP